MKNAMMIGLLLGLAAALVTAPAVYAQDEAVEEEGTRPDKDRAQDAEIAGLDEADAAAGEHGAEGRAIARKASSAKGPAAAEVAGEKEKPSFLKRMWNKLTGEKGDEAKEAAKGKRAGGEEDGGEKGAGREGKAGLGLDKADEAAGEHGAEGRAIARESVKKDGSEGAAGAEKREQAKEKSKELREGRGQDGRGERERERAMERRGPGGPGGSGGAGGRPGGRGR